MNIAERLHTVAEESPHRAAIIDTHHGRSRTTTFAGLERSTIEIATTLARAELRPGDRVLVLLPMSAELYQVLGALFRLGLVAMFLDPSAGLRYIQQCCELLPPDALVTGTKGHLLRLVSGAVRRVPHTFTIGVPILGTLPFCGGSSTGQCEYGYMVKVAPDTPALLTFTSGSTGQPKAVVRSHGFLLEQHRVLAQSLGLQAGRVDLATLPIFVLANLASGVTSVLPDADLRRPGHIQPAPVVAQMQAHQVHSIAASPALLERLTRYCYTHSLSLPTLRKVFSGGAPVFPRLLEQVQAIAPYAEVVALYGSTEAEPIAHIARTAITTHDWQAMAQGGGLLVGAPVEAIQMRILADEWGTPRGPYRASEFATLCLPAVVPGEIVVSGGHVVSGYVGGRGDHETKFTVDGVVWHRTGDAGYIDHQGRLWLLGRCAARMHDAARGTLYPFPLECMLSMHAAIRRAAVVEHDGRRVVALELDRHQTIDLVQIEQQVAQSGVDEIRCYPRLPVDRRHNAKIDYPSLHALLMKRSATRQRVC